MSNTFLKNMQFCQTFLTLPTTLVILGFTTKKKPALPIKFLPLETKRDDDKPEIKTPVISYTKTSSPSASAEKPKLVLLKAVDHNIAVTNTTSTQDLRLFPPPTSIKATSEAINKHSSSHLPISEIAVKPHDLRPTSPLNNNPPSTIHVKTNDSLAAPVTPTLPIDPVVDPLFTYDDPISSTPLNPTTHSTNITFDCLSPVCLTGQNCSKDFRIAKMGSITIVNESDVPVDPQLAPRISPAALEH
ncbi:hypothetical protein PSHT_09363 [Puccinia striiformis]|uniref:Uncharacterized protein n=1 Tax=Puccinia striiformis TaxID=27350 RepID=A0A2S4VHC8_9BASI|nr:hypothetical protein PSHT_09363 [Puccinia striiformis]